MKTTVNALQIHDPNCVQLFLSFLSNHEAVSTDPEDFSQLQSFLLVHKFPREEAKFALLRQVEVPLALEDYFPPTVFYISTFTVNNEP